MQILIDTNLLLRSVEPSHPHRDTALAAMEACRSQGHRLVLVPQVVYEFWVVATRPEHRNGFDLATDLADQKTSELLRLFRLLRDERSIFDYWRAIVKRHDVKGKNAHDARLVAAMRRHNLEYVLTFNTSDFARYDGITALDPVKVASGAATLPSESE